MREQRTAHYATRFGGLFGTAVWGRCGLNLRRISAMKSTRRISGSLLCPALASCLLLGGCSWLLSSDPVSEVDDVVNAYTCRCECAKGQIEWARPAPRSRDSRFRSIERRPGRPSLQSQQPELPGSVRPEPAPSWPGCPPPENHRNCRTPQASLRTAPKPH